MKRQQFYLEIARREGRKVEISMGNAREAGARALDILGELWDRDPRAVADLLRKSGRTRKKKRKKKKTGTEPDSKTR